MSLLIDVRKVMMLSGRLGIYTLLSLLVFLEGAWAGNATRDIFHFECDNGKSITATHPDVGITELLIDGRSFWLHQVPESKGIRYATKKGLTSQTGLIFWSFGSTAELYKISNTESLGMTTSHLITTCAMNNAEKKRMETKGVTVTKINRVRGDNGIIMPRNNSINDKFNE